MNNQIVAILLVAVSFSSLYSCQNKAKETTSGQVTVSILPQKFVVDRISGNQLKVNVLVPPGAKPETYSLLPSQLKALSESTDWLRIGYIGFEQTWLGKISEANPELKIIDCSDGVDLIKDIDEHEGHHHIHGIDPHIWIGPDEMKIITQNTLTALINSFPEKKLIFENNAQLLLSEIDSVKHILIDQLSDLSEKEFLIFHPGLGYFARTFNLVQIPIELEGKEPSPRYMKDIVDIALSKGIKTIFIQKEFDVKNANQLSKEIDGNVIIIDPLAYSWIDQMLYIGSQFSEEENK